MTTPLPVPARTAGQDVNRQRALDALSKLPPFSPILSKLMASLAGQDVSFVVLGDLIEKDAVVAGNILRVVNSAIYARRGEVNSIRHALSVLGVEKVRNTVLAMSISRMLNQAKTPPGWSMERFNRHSAAVAMLSDLLAQHVRVEYPEGAFVGGLLHDVGQMLIAMGLPKEFSDIQRIQLRDQAPWIECERSVLGFDHACLSADALQVWKLPDPIRFAVGQHHDDAPTRSGPVLPLGCVLRAANLYVNSLGHTIRNMSVDEQQSVEAFQGLGLAPDVLERLIEQFHTEHNAIAQFYQ